MNVMCSRRPAACSISDLTLGHGLFRLVSLDAVSEQNFPGAKWRLTGKRMELSSSRVTGLCHGVVRHSDGNGHKKIRSDPIVGWLVGCM
jgi:hypothetical protein